MNDGLTFDGERSFEVSDDVARQIYADDLAEAVRRRVRERELVAADKLRAWQAVGRENPAQAWEYDGRLYCGGCVAAQSLDGKARIVLSGLRACLRNPCCSCGRQLLSANKLTTNER